MARNYLFYLEDMMDAMLRILEYVDSITFEEFKNSNLEGFEKLPTSLRLHSSYLLIALRLTSY